jgi:nitrous oxide reductase accessory protein NosL
MRRFAAACESVAVAAALLLGACDSGSGPVDVKLGRDVCEMCGMIISDPRFLTEVRLGDGKIHKFDDVGDAVNWLSSGCRHTLADVKEFWVTDSAHGKTWLDARKAFYRRAETPMNYGFGAVATQIPGSVAFEDMRASVAREKYACKGAPKSEGDAQPSNTSQ